MVSALPPARAAALAREALANGSEEEALPLVASAAAAVRDDATLWQWTGLLHRACDDRRAALTAFANARRHAPHDPLLAHSEALTMLEAGLPAVEAFEQARTLAPTDAGVLLGLAASYVAAGESQRAAEDLRALLREHPGWLDGHRNLSHLAWTLGEGDDSDRSYRDALRRFPRDQALWQGLVVMLVQAGRFERALAAIADARSVIGDQAFLVANEAAARSELRQDAAADAAFARLAGISDVAVAIRRVRHLLRTARHDAARDVAEPWLDRPGGEGMWPYVGLAWRLLGDPRYPWLAGDAALVSVQDLSADVPDAGALERLLRSLHVARGQQYDQSVRGGTQTEGALLQRIEPEIVALRQAIVATVRRYVAQLPSVVVDTPSSACAAIARSGSPDRGRFASRRAAAMPITSIPPAGSVPRYMSCCHRRTPMMVPIPDGCRSALHPRSSAWTCRRPDGSSPGRCISFCFHQSPGTAPSPLRQASE